MPPKKAVRRRPGRTRRRRQYNKKKRGQKYTMHAVPSMIIRPRAFIKLKYLDTDTPLIALSTLNYIGTQTYNINGAYDVNPSIASSAMPGFIEWSGFYKRYRVRAVKIASTFVNTVSTPYYCGTMMITTGPGLSSWADWREQEGNNYCQVKLMTGNQAQGVVRNKVYAKMGTMYGNKVEYIADNQFSGLTGVVGAGSNPVIVFNAINFILSSDGNLFSGNVNVPVKTTITMYIELFERFNLYS